MYGCNGRFLKVNLSTGTISEETYDKTFAKMFLGGNGLAAKLIHDGVPSDADPLGPENAIVLTVGPLTDTPIWGTSRGHMASLSPMTGLFADSNYGGKFATMQKRAGFDAIYITGKSDKPVYLLVTDEGAEIKDGTDYWGKTTEDTLSGLETREGEGAVCAAIGPAGENKVHFANVACGGKRLGVAGRAGMGAVMGSKNLKAVLVRGTKKTRIADREALKQVLKEKYPDLKQNAAALTNMGTPFLVKFINSKGLLGTRNNTKEVYEHFHDISGELIKEKYWEEDTACFGCPVACGKKIRIKKGEYAGKKVKMPEYETIYALGSMLDNRDVESIFDGNHLCNLLGLDTISMGVTLAFVAECMEKGIVTEEDLGESVKFEDGAGMIEFIKKTANKAGIGEYLAMGSTRLAEKFGGDAYKYLHAVKGLEIPGHSPRGLRGMSLSYPTSNRGGSHHDGRPNYATADSDPGFETQPEYILKSQCFTAVGDSLVICRFIAERGVGTPLNEDMVHMVNSVTGWNLQLEDLEKIGERIYNLEHLINIRRGFRREDVTLPYRVMNEPIPDGPAKGRYCTRADLDSMLDQYFRLRGWDRNGVPTDEKLIELGLK
jgi:aldehyde:ferredoxin oxidoreductase